MFEIKFNSQPTIVHVNLRKEGAEHDILAVDVKVKGECPGANAAAMLGCDPEHLTALWFDDIEGHPARFTGVSSIDSWAKFENCIASIGGIAFEGVTAKKFKIKPVGGGNVEITFQIGISRIPPKLVGRLGDMAQEHAKVEIRGEEDLFDEDPGNDKDTDFGDPVTEADLDRAIAEAEAGDSVVEPISKAKA